MEVEEAPTSEELEQVEDGFDVLFDILKSIVHDENLSRTEKIEGVERSLESIRNFCEKNIGETTPQTPENLLAEITEAASKKAVEQISELLAPLVETVKQLESGQQIPTSDIPQRKGLIGDRGGEKEENIPWWERLGIEK